MVKIKLLSSIKPPVIDTQNLNPKALEIFAKNLIDAGMGIYKALFLLITIVPLSLLIKSIFNLGAQNTTLYDLFSSFSYGTFVFAILFFVLSIWIAETLRNTGINHLHNLERSLLDKK